jgi:EAL and modified HD-GYP domain-containing signal transduction protein
MSVLTPEYILLAKQAIYDLNKNCYAYELLFRTPMGSSAKDFGGEIATSQVLVNYCASISEESEESQLPVFVNVDSQFILEFDSLPVSPETIVIELTGRVEPSDVLIESIKAWKKLGFKFAFDCYDFQDKWNALILEMNFVKIDILPLDDEVLRNAMNKLDRKSCKWVAKRVEDEDAFELCRALGFDFVQGYFLAKPKPVMGSSIRPGTAVTIKLLKALDRPGITMQQIAELVSQDPKLTVQMLKIINSSLFSLPRPVDDLQAALIYLGVDMLRQWAMMIAFLSNGNVHIEACRLVLLRAKTCELLCRDNVKLVDHSSSAFLAGLVSGVDILLKISARDFIAQVNLSEKVHHAVLNGDGELGSILETVCDLEYIATQNPNTIDEIAETTLCSYKEASQWVMEVIKALKGR